MFQDDGVMPNHPFFPVVLYSGAMRGRIEQTEAIFNRHNWLNSWTNGVYGYQHYHSNAHDALGVIRGSAVLQLGGREGMQVELAAGDVVVLPAGTAHKKISVSREFLIVGAYPYGMDYNLRTGKAGERPKVLEEILLVPTPRTDPLYGGDGPLMKLFRKGTRPPFADGLLHEFLQKMQHFCSESEISAELLHKRQHFGSKTVVSAEVVAQKATFQFQIGGFS